MEILNIAILDDSQSKITRIKTKFSQHNDKETSLYDERYAKYKLNLCQIDVEKSCNEIIFSCKSFSCLVCSRIISFSYL